jgi:hypothetical protein
MIRTRIPALASVLLLACASVDTPARAASTHSKDADITDGSTTSSPTTRDPRIRTTDRRMRKLIDEGVRASASLRALVRRIEQSDVVVYVHCEPHMQSRAAGRLIFVSAGGGLRYVVVQLARSESRPQQIALLAHELQHAVEIADTPSIVDGPSLAREYLRMGHVNHLSSTQSIAFDTDAAVEMGAKVLDEIAAVTGD